MRERLAIDYYPLAARAWLGRALGAALALCGATLVTATILLVLVLL